MIAREKMLTGKTEFTTVQGVRFEHFPDFITSATYAVNLETGEMKCIHKCGYLSKDLSVRKAIANVFGFASFRK